MSVLVVNDSFVPHVRKKIVLADNALAIADEILQEIEYLGLNGDEVICAPQFSAVCVKGAIFKEIDHPQVLRSPPIGASEGKTSAIPAKNQG